MGTPSTTGRGCHCFGMTALSECLSGGMWSCRPRSHSRGTCGTERPGDQQMWGVWHVGVAAGTRGAVGWGVGATGFLGQ